MAQFRNGVLTNRGLDLLARAQAGTANIVFTKFQIGDGQWPDDVATETIMASIALRNYRQEFNISSAEAINPATSLLTMTASNQNNQQGFYIREVGVFAQDGNSEILYAVYLAMEADWFPAYNSVTPSSITYSAYITVANAPNVEIVNPGGSLVTWNELGERLPDETAQSILMMEQANTELVGIVLEEMADLIENLPQDETLGEIERELYAENGWLDVIVREVGTYLEEE